ncbi:MAG: sulfite exporter TauE/SafE family protein [Bilifractor sp.]|jgi:uncharacterized membrane protein YfcA
MVLTARTFLLVCPMLFLAGFVDSVAGGGGLISMPVYLIAGLPPHSAVATNKMSSTFGTTLSTIRFFRNGLINLKLAFPSVAAAICGSALGAHISMSIDETVLRRVMILILPVAAFFVLNKKLFNDNGRDAAVFTKRTVIVTVVSAFVIGMYDGFYGPGTGTFLIIAFTVFARIGIKSANAQAKVVNMTTNWTALVIFLFNGKVILPLGAAAAVCNIAGNYVGSGLVMEKGASIVRPVMLAVLVLLFLRMVGFF